MKYKLKRDLPFAKAGTEVKLVNEKKAIEYNGYQCDIYDLRDGWIEEVKPREWYEVETRKPDGTWNSHSHLRYYNEQSARDATCRCEVNARFIKVREVIH